MTLGGKTNPIILNAHQENFFIGGHEPLAKIDRHVVDIYAPVSNPPDLAKLSCPPAVSCKLFGSRPRLLAQAGNIDVDALVDELTDLDEDVRDRVLEALRKIDPAVAIPALVRGLNSNDEGLRQNIVYTLGQLGSIAKDAVPSIIKEFCHGNVYMRAIAAEALGNIGPEARDAVHALINALRDPDEYVRQSAARALGEIGEASAEPALIKALEDSEFMVQDAALLSLGMMGDKAAFAALPRIMALLKDPDWRIRRSAVVALTEMGTTAKPVVSMLTEALKDPHNGVRIVAIGALANIGEAARSAIPELIAMLKDEDWSIRAAAANALGIMGSRLAVAALEMSLEDENVIVSEAAYEALEKIKHTP